MKKVILNNNRRNRRKFVIRKKIFGTSERPRLSVYRSNKYIYVQVIDDDNGKTLAAASSIKLGDKNKLNIATAQKVGADIAKKIKDCKIESIIFDRNGYLYAGKIKALADSVRKEGIKF